MEKENICKKIKKSENMKWCGQIDFCYAESTKNQLPARAANIREVSFYETKTYRSFVNLYTCGDCIYRMRFQRKTFGARERGYADRKRGKYGTCGFR